MIVVNRLRGVAAALLVGAAAAAPAAPPDRPYVPVPGEIGKDVMWLPTAPVMVKKMLDLAAVRSRDFVVDLGSGDGRIVIAAARRGARALGVEYNPDLVEYARREAAKARVSNRARFVQGDLFEADLSGATVITLFLLEENNLKLRPKLLDLKPGTRIVSNEFTMGDWPADRTLDASRQEGCTAYCTAHLWVVPARVEGRWRLPDGELVLQQSFQMLRGTLRTGATQTAVEGRMNGERIRLRAGEARYAGRVRDGAMRGEYRSGAVRGFWSATRVGP